MTWPDRQNKQLSALLQDRVSRNKHTQHRLRTLQTQQQFIWVQQLFSHAGLKGTLGDVTNASGTGWFLGGYRTSVLRPQSVSCLPPGVTHLAGLIWG